MINREALVDPNSSDHVVALTELREQVATLQKQLTGKDNQLLTKEKQVSVGRLAWFNRTWSTWRFRLPKLNNKKTNKKTRPDKTRTFGSDHRAQSGPVPHGTGAPYQDANGAEGLRRENGRAPAAHQRPAERGGRSEKGQQREARQGDEGHERALVRLANSRQQLDADDNKKSRLAFRLRFGQSLVSESLSRPTVTAASSKKTRKFKIIPSQSSGEANRNWKIQCLWTSLNTSAVESKKVVTKGLLFTT